MRQDEIETWTPKLVGETLISAIRWARYNAGPTGPAGVRALMPIYVPTAEDRALEGWGDHEIPEIAPEKPTRRPLRPSEVSLYEEALYWAARYAVPYLPTSARVLNIWLRCKVHKKAFAEVIDRRGEMSRASAYRYRDRALSAIAQGLEKDGVPVV